MQYYNPGVGSDFPGAQLGFNEAFNATDSLFNSPVCGAAYCFFASLLVLRVNGYYVQTNKEKVDDYRR